MKTLKLICAALVGACIAVPAAAQTTIVNEDFESYADNSALLAAWPSSSGSDNGLAITTSSEFYPGIQGQAAEFCGTLDAATCDPTGAGTVNLFGGNPLNGSSVGPSPTENLVLSVDIGDDALSGNKRLTVGLRNSTNVQNIIEMGFYNDPTHFAYRAILFEDTGGGIGPNWQNFSLPEELDSPAEVGAHFHRFKAVISENEIEFSLDLYADGKTNDPLDPQIGVGADGVDAIDVVAAKSHPGGYDDLRIGLPSALPSSGGSNPAAAFAAFDNILLQLAPVDGPTVDADFNGDGLVAGDDFVTWQRNTPLTDGTGLLADGDANGDGNVDLVDLAAWESQLGASSASAAVAAAPEPTAALLAAFALAGVCGLRRRQTCAR